MKTRLVLAVVVVGLGVVACSSTPTSSSASDSATHDSGKPAEFAGDASSDTGPRPLSNGGGPDCGGACCTKPQAGTACASTDEGVTCSESALCPGGLILPQPLKCQGGTWKQDGGECSLDGGVAGNGCPDSQPANATSCSLPEGTWCQYALVCPNKCDAGTPPAGGDGGWTTGTGCASASKVGPAFCRSGAWETTALGSCP